MPTLLGLLDGEIDSKYTVTWNTNKSGGKPNWMHADQPQLSCGGCGQSLSLIVQLYCPLADSPYHRTLYVLVCLSGARCWLASHGWMVLRSQCLDASRTISTNESKKLATMDTDDWGCDMDDWGESSNDTIASSTVAMGTERDILKSSTNNSGLTKMCQLGQAAGDCDDSNNSYNNFAMVPVAGDDKRNVECVSVSLNASQWGHNNGTNSCDQTLNNFAEENNMCAVKQDTCSINSSLSDTDPSSLLRLKQMNIHVIDNFDDDDDKADSVSVEETDVGVCDTDTYLPSEETVNNMLSLLMCKQRESSSNDSRHTGCSGECRELKAYFISVIEEVTSVGKVTEKDAHIDEMIQAYEQSHGIDLKKLLRNSENTPSKASGSEGYEKSDVLHKDALFHKFYKKIVHTPQQCIRYNWQGVPLYITEPDVTALHSITQSVCVHCGGPRVFELQLMPALVQHLKGHGCDVEFGTILIFTCRGSCWSAGDETRSESVFVMVDPDQDLFR